MKVVHESCHRIRFNLSKTIQVEEWLANMALKGSVLHRIEDGKFYFRESVPVKYRFFLLNSEIGANSEDWIFYEFERTYGRRIPCSGPTFTSPSHALLVPQCCEEDACRLINYYYDYRNYRLARRFCKNAIVFSLVTLFCLLIGILGEAKILLMFLPYLLVSSVLCVYFWWALFHFLKTCSGCSQKSVWEKPKHP